MSEAKITKADVKEFVEAAHGNLEKVKQMLSEKPLLLNMPNGNETALGAACQMKHAALIQFLISQGAPMDISAACVLGMTEKVTEFLDADPSLINTKNKQSHGKTPIVFASEQPEVLALLRSRGEK
ncbi:hypothetical protein CCAX7_47960 [Capsulimonas corticalis]|uniref:Uncharacterized protein n=1 Tax=Capsulimonas corticalis TaxID=2219043 RepID=A0A402CQ79_9BACT|nr:ankyrin repeat domain-containing protein [Capsulimonas corticalis]BDI32745.1 hypothetical protein CCAX7_47960 [Capsulimonas corticalis]